MESKPHPSRRSLLSKRRDGSGLLRSSFARLDSFFNLDRTGDRGMSEDAESIATELRHLHHAEDELRRELDAIGSSDVSENKKNVSADVSENNKNKNVKPLPPALKKRRDSFSSLKRQVSDDSFRNLQLKLNEMFHSDEVGTAVTDISNSPGRQKRPSMNFQRNDEKELYSHNFIEKLANAVFGRREYTVKPMFAKKSDEPCTRTVQGGVVVTLASAILVSRLQIIESTVLPILFVPLAVTWIEIHSFHRLEETSIALGILVMHFVISHYGALIAP